MTSETLQKARDYEAEHGAAISPDERPLFHLSTRVGWMNDPNGFSHYDGAFHLFYQYHPYTTQWGPMHWGHASTTDLLHWSYLPAAIAPDQPYDGFGCFSGSATQLPDGRQLLVYTGVREGPQTDGHPTIIQEQCVAAGDGTDYDKYSQNPVMKAADLPDECDAVDFRDPKAFLRSDGTYGCVVGNRLKGDNGCAVLFQSDDGFEWRFADIVDRSRGELGTMWECPDFFELDGNDVLLICPMGLEPQGLEYHNGSHSVCVIGTYQPGQGMQRRNVHVVDYGLDFYAPQTVLAPDGRRIMIGWMQNWDTSTPNSFDAKYFGQMSLPRELHVRDGRLVQAPAREIEAVRDAGVCCSDVLVGQQPVELQGVRGRLLDLTVTVRPTSPDSMFELFTIKFAQDGKHYCSVTFDPSASTTTISRVHSGSTHDWVHQRSCLVREQDGQVKIRLILDRFSAEVFVNDGEQTQTMTFNTAQEADGISFEVQGGQAIIDVEKYGLQL